MTAPLMVRVDFAYAGVKAVGAERHMADELRRNPMDVASFMQLHV